MSLRSTILRHSLPLLPTYSFSRQTLQNALTHLPANHPDHRDQAEIPLSVIDTLFGDSEVSAGKALVEAWETRGRQGMSQDLRRGSQDGARKEDDVASLLARRLAYSSTIHEHLVEAYALLSSPESPPSIPFPHLPKSITSLASTFLPKLPPLYSPRRETGNAVHSEIDPKEALKALLSSLSSTLGSTEKIPLITINPFGAFQYAWRIADDALTVISQNRKGEMKLGVMSEPVGSGPEWYTTRLGLSLAYLTAESHLLQPYRSNLLPSDPNPHLPAALAALQQNLKTHHDLGKSVEQIEKGAGDWMGFGEFTGKSFRGLLRSRGL